MLPVAYSVFYGKRNLGSYITFSCHVSLVSFNLEQFLRLYHNKKFISKWKIQHLASELITKMYMIL